MMPDNVAMFATIILLLPMFYLLLAAPAFLMVRLDIRPVALLLRGMFNGYFLTLAAAAVVGTIAVAMAGRLVLAIGIGLIGFGERRAAFPGQRTRKMGALGVCAPDVRLSADSGALADTAEGRRGRTGDSCTAAKITYA